MLGKKTREEQIAATGKRTFLERDQARDVHREGIAARNREHADLIAEKYGLRGKQKQEGQDYTRDAMNKQAEKAGRKAENSAAVEKHKENAIEIGSKWGNDLWEMAAKTFNDTYASVSTQYSNAANYVVEKAIGTKENSTRYAQSKGLAQDAPNSADLVKEKSVAGAKETVRHMEQSDFKAAMRAIRKTDDKVSAVIEREDSYRPK